MEDFSKIEVVNTERRVPFKGSIAPIWYATQRSGLYSPCHFRNLFVPLSMSFQWSASLSVGELYRRSFQILTEGWGLSSYHTPTSQLASEAWRVWALLFLPHFAKQLPQGLALVVGSVFNMSTVTLSSLGAPFPFVCVIAFSISCCVMFPLVISIWNLMYSMTASTSGSGLFSVSLNSSYRSYQRFDMQTRRRGQFRIVLTL